MVRKPVYKAIGRMIGDYDEENNEADFIVSTEAPDRDGDTVDQESLDWSEFDVNPIMTLTHDTDSIPVGRWKPETRKIVMIKDPGTQEEVKATQMRGRFNIHTEQGREVADSVKGDFMSSASVSFLPDGKEQKNNSGGHYYTNAKVTETAVCAVPANQGATRAVEMVLKKYKGKAHQGWWVTFTQDGKERTVIGYGNTQQEAEADIKGEFGQVEITNVVQRSLKKSLIAKYKITGGDPGEIEDAIFDLVGSRGLMIEGRSGAGAPVVFEVDVASDNEANNLTRQLWSKVQPLGGKVLWLGQRFPHQKSMGGEAVRGHDGWYVYIGDEVQEGPYSEEEAREIAKNLGIKKNWLGWCYAAASALNLGAGTITGSPANWIIGGSLAGQAFAEFLKTAYEDGDDPHDAAIEALPLRRKDKIPKAFRPGDKVRITSGDSKNERGQIVNVSGGKATVKLDFMGDTVTVPEAWLSYKNLRGRKGVKMVKCVVKTAKGYIKKAGSLKVVSGPYDGKECVPIGESADQPGKMVVEVEKKRLLMDPRRLVTKDLEYTQDEDEAQDFDDEAATVMASVEDGAVQESKDHLPEEGFDEPKNKAPKVERLAEAEDGPGWYIVDDGEPIAGPYDTDQEARDWLSRHGPLMRSKAGSTPQEMRSKQKWYVTIWPNGNPPNSGYYFTPPGNWSVAHGSGDIDQATLSEIGKKILAHQVKLFEGQANQTTQGNAGGAKWQATASGEFDRQNNYWKPKSKSDEDEPTAEQIAAKATEMIEAGVDEEEAPAMAYKSLVKRKRFKVKVGKKWIKRNKANNLSVGQKVTDGKKTGTIKRVATDEVQVKWDKYEDGIEWVATHTLQSKDGGDIELVETSEEATEMSKADADEVAEETGGEVVQESKGVLDTVPTRQIDVDQVRVGDTVIMPSGRGLSVQRVNFDSSSGKVVVTSGGRTYEFDSGEKVGVMKGKAMRKSLDGDGPSGLNALKSWKSMIEEDMGKMHKAEQESVMDVGEKILKMIKGVLVKKYGEQDESVDKNGEDELIAAAEEQKRRKSINKADTCPACAGEDADCDHCGGSGVIRSKAGEDEELDEAIDFAEEVVEDEQVSASLKAGCAHCAAQLKSVKHKGLSKAIRTKSLSKKQKEALNEVIEYLDDASNNSPPHLKAGMKHFASALKELLPKELPPAEEEEIELDISDEAVEQLQGAAASLKEIDERVDVTEKSLFSLAGRRSSN